MDISNNYTAFEDQNINASLLNSTDITGTFNVALSVEPCATGNTAAPVIPVTQAASNLAGNYSNLGPSGISVESVSTPSPNVGNDIIRTKIADISQTPVPVFDQNLHTTIPSPSSTVSVYDVPRTQTGSRSGTYAAYYRFGPPIDDPNIPSFGPNDPLNNPNRKHSVNSNLCDTFPWELLTIPCPTCDGGKKKTLENKAGKKYIDLTAFFPRAPLAIRSVVGGIDDFINGTIHAVDVTSLFKKGKCPTCEGKNKVKDSSGQSGINAKKAAQHLDSKKDEIMKHEANAGAPSGCGNRYSIIAGHDCLEVGLGMNNATSYRVDPEGTQAPGYHGTDVAQVTVNKKSPAVYGTNPPSTPGGHYVIKCSNKFTAFSGAQGIELVTHGPVNIAGGITKITGPEVTIGSQSGPVTVSGHHLQLTGKTLALNATDGDSQVVVQGTLGVASNMVVGGGAHVEGDLSFISASAPSTIKRTKFSGPPDMNSGMAAWGGIAVKAISKHIENMQRDVAIWATDPSLSLASPKGQQKLNDHMKHLSYLCNPYEQEPTGWIIPGTTWSVLIDGYPATIEAVGPCDLNNFPHQHQLPDMFHTHEFEAPNIKLLDDAKSVRENSSAKKEKIPATANPDQDRPGFLEPILQPLKIVVAKATDTYAV
jgi:hypothetical protein